MRISSVGTAYPPNRYPQAVIAQALAERWQDKLPEPRLLTRLHANCGVEFRNIVFPMESYPALVGFQSTNDAWINAALPLGECAVVRALQRAGITAADVSAIFFASVTGISSPTIDARLINRLPFPIHVKRTPIFGLGCVAGAAGISRAADYVRAFPKEIALLLSVELCSTPPGRTTSRSIANLISTGLFADGAAAVVIAGAESKLATATTPSPRSSPPALPSIRNTEYVMGWDIIDTGFRIVLSPDVPRVVTENILGDVEGFLTDNNLTQWLSPATSSTPAAQRSLKPWRPRSACLRTPSRHPGSRSARSAISPPLPSLLSLRTISPSTPARPARTASSPPWGLPSAPS